MAEKYVLVEKRGKIGYVIFNRPDRLNALNSNLLHDFDKVMDGLRGDRDVNVVIIKGSGRAFSAGYDVGSDDPGRKEAKKSVTNDRAALENHITRWLGLWEYPKPVIAQVHGYALAGSTQLCTCCDIVITAEDAQFGFPSLPLGGGMLGTMWMWHVGPQRAKLMDLTAGSRISGKEATEWGIAAKCFPVDRLEEETLKIAQDIAKTPLDILELKKKALNRVMDLQGFRTAALFGPEQDAIIHTADGVKLSVQKIKELGVRGAVDWFNNQSV